MATVEFSPVHIDYMIRYNGYGIWGSTSSSATPSSSVMGGAGTKLILFPGTIPAQPRLMTSSDIAAALIYWTPSSDSTTLSYTNPYTTTTIYKSAIATGTATWFSLCYYTVNPPATNGTLVQRIIGTVGTIGSGADLEMGTTNIVTGSQYRIYNFRIQLPSTYTY